MADPVDTPMTEEQMIADVFGFGPTPTPSAPAATDPGAGDTPVSPPPGASVGTEGDAGGVAPAAAPASTPQPSSEPLPPVQPDAPAPGQQPAAPDVAPDPRELKISSLEGTLADMQARLDAMTRAPAEGQPAPTNTGFNPATFDPAKPEMVQVQLPPEITNSIFDEDPVKAAAGLNALVSQIVSANVHRTRTDIQAALAHYQQQQLQQTQTQQTAEQQNALAGQQRQAYFGKFPDHNSPIVLPLVGQAVQELVAQFPGAKWDDNFMLALGAKVNQTLQASGFQFAGPGNPTATKGASATPPAPAAMMPIGTTSAPPSATPTEQEIMTETFSWAN